MLPKNVGMVPVKIRFYKVPESRVENMLQNEQHLHHLSVLYNRDTVGYSERGISVESCSNYQAGNPDGCCVRRPGRRHLGNVRNVPSIVVVVIVIVIASARCCSCVACHNRNWTSSICFQRKYGGAGTRMAMAGCECPLCCKWRRTKFSRIRR